MDYPLNGTSSWLDPFQPQIRREALHKYRACSPYLSESGTAQYRHITGTLLDYHFARRSHLSDTIAPIDSAGQFQIHWGTLRQYGFITLKHYSPHIL